MSINLFPRFSLIYSRDGGLADAIKLCNLTLAQSLFKEMSYFLNFCHRKFGRMQSFFASLTAFGDLIFHVLLLSPEKKMIGPDTKLVITSVKNKKSFRDGSVMQLPRISMGHNGLFNPKRTISIRANASEPFPTGMLWNHGDVLPKNLFSGRSWINPNRHNPVYIGGN